jgi:hypothetical protein
MSLLLNKLICKPRAGVVALALYLMIPPSPVASQTPNAAELPTPQEAYQQLLNIRQFAFGGIGFAGLTSPGEKAYRSIAGATNAVALFSAMLTNGNPQARLYALCGIRQLAPGSFDALARPLRSASLEVETVQGCIIQHEPAKNVIARIESGSYDAYLKKARQ